MRILKWIWGRCSNCGCVRIGGRHKGDRFFCSKECYEWGTFPGFCGKCLSETTIGSLGGTARVNGIGTTLWQSWYRKHVCPDCKSRVLRMWFSVFFLPVYPVSEKYRVKFMAPRRHVSRKLLTQ
jgi:hypothetical protein